MKTLFCTGFGPIVDEMGPARKLYLETLRLPLEGRDDYLATANLEGETRLDGVKHFAVWLLRDAAQSCFDRDDWPSEIPVPQGWIEFDVDDVAEATKELEEKGYQLLCANKVEPWGQVATRLLGPDGLLLALCYTPEYRRNEQ